MTVQVPVSQQVEQITKQLTAALIRKEEAQRELAEAEKTIHALRNVLAGVSLGQQLASEMSSAKSADESKKED